MLSKLLSLSLLYSCTLPGPLENDVWVPSGKIEFVETTAVPQYSNLPNKRTGAVCSPYLRKEPLSMFGDYF